MVGNESLESLLEEQIKLAKDQDHHQRTLTGSGWTGQEMATRRLRKRNQNGNKKFRNKKNQSFEETGTWEMTKLVERLSKIRIMRGLLILPIRKLSVTLVGAVLLEQVVFRSQIAVCLEPSKISVQKARKVASSSEQRPADSKPVRHNELE